MWDTLVQANNLQELPMAATIFNKPEVCRAIKYAISDSGATGHFIVEGSPVVNKQPSTNPLKITLPNGKVVQSTHTCNIDIPWLPDQTTEAHILPVLAHSSLILTWKFCDAGCKVVLNMTECWVYHKGKLVLTEGRDAATVFWKLPTNSAGVPGQVPTTIDSIDLHLQPNQNMHHMAHNMYTLP